MSANLLKEWLGHRTGRFAAVLALYTLLFLLWVAFGAASLPHRTAIGDLAFLPIGLTAAVLALRLGGHPGLRAHERSAWRLLGLGMSCYVAGDVLWAYYEVVLGSDPFPSPADAGYLLFYPLVMIGLLTFPYAPRTKQSQVKFWLDAATILLGGFMLIWYFLLGPIALSEVTDTTTLVLTTAYPIGDLVLVFGAAAILLRQPDRGSRHALGMLAAGIAAFLVADIAFGYRDLQGVYEAGDWPDAFWMLAWGLFASGGLYQSWRASTKPPVEHWPADDIQNVSAAPYLAVVLGYGLLFVSGGYATPYPLGGLLYSAIAITAFVLLRQLTVMGENLRLMADLRELATTDSLTGLLNRREFFAQAEREFARYQRYRHPLAAIMIDIDTFKVINDQYGHRAGDLVMQTVAGQLRNELRKVDLAGRYGGDELAILLPMTALHDASGVAQRLLAAVAENPVAFEAHLIKISISAGITTAEGMQSLAALLHRADEALYEAKQAGRNRIKLAMPGVS